MKHLSIRFKITLWFTAALILVVALSYFAVLSVSSRILQKTIQDTLIETVENNVDEIEYFTSADPSNDTDYYLPYGDGYLEIDDDFLDEVNDVYTTLYHSDGNFLYGENPISKYTPNLEFQDAVVQQVKVHGTLYYIYDRLLSGKKLDGLWLRGVVSEEQGDAQISAIVRASLVLLPAFVILASTGGYLLAQKSLRPIQQISETASQIGKGGDLKKRIDLGSGTDELHALADTFNEMFERLDTAFETERRFTSDASHELRTPMSVILAQCELSLEKPRSPEEYEDALRIIYRQGRRMSKLINDMLDFTRLELKADTYPKSRLNLSGLFSSICEDMSLIGEHGITLTAELEPDILAVGNRDLLSRLLVNLISNAYRYGKDNGHIWVTLTRSQEQIILSVTDDGIGIAPEDQEKIFRRFYQADPSRYGNGTGLGLSMAAEIAQFHDGNIRVESEPQKGSRFIFSFHG